MDLNNGAKNFGLLIKTTFITIPPSLFTAHNTENDYYDSKNSCYPYCRQAASQNTTDTKGYPEIVTTAHFLHVATPRSRCIYYILCKKNLIVTENQNNFSAFYNYFHFIGFELIALG